MDALWQDLRQALRILRKSPGFTTVAVLTLALGIGANTAIFSVVEKILLRPLPYRDPASLVEIWNTYLPQFPQASLSGGDFQDFKREAKSFSAMSCYVDIPDGQNLTGDGDAQRVETRYVTYGFFELLGVRLEGGRTFTPDEDKAGQSPVVMASHQLWQSRFGMDRSVIGHTVMLDGHGYTLVGVLPASFRLAPATDLWMPFGQYADDLTSHVHHPCTVVARLKNGVSAGAAQAELEGLNQQEAQALPDVHKGWGVLVKRMEDPAAVKMRLALLILLGAVGLVLLVACANIVNLLLARNAARQKEIALRVALGANRWRLLRQLLTESVVLSCFGGVLGIWLASAGFHLLSGSVPPNLAAMTDTGLNGWVLGFTIALTLLTGLVCGLIPATQTLQQDLHGVLKEGTRTSGVGAGQRLRSFLVISEIALALIPLVGAGLLIRSLHRLVEVSPGFSQDHLLAMEVNLPQLTYREAAKLTFAQQIEVNTKQALQFDELAQKIRELPGVKSVGGISVMPLGAAIRSASRFVIEGQPLPANGARPIAETRLIDPGYFATMGIPLRIGRKLDSHDYGTPNTSVVVNEALAKRFFDGGDALGKRVNLCSVDPTPCWSTIVGVVGNVHQYGLEAAATLDMYFVGGWPRYVAIRTAAEPAALAQSIINRIHSYDSTLPVAHVMTLDALLADSVSSRRFSTFLLGAFAGLALVLAAVGIYGVMSYVVSMRTSEIGMRMALGAQPGDIWKLVIGRGARLAFAGVALGLLGAFALTKLIASLLFGVQPTDPVTFCGVTILLVGVALLACYVPARRAMRVDPIIALRYE